jgi:signal transduction histidine kinase
VVESKATRFEGIRGEGYQALVVGRDVTERQRAERERAEMEVSLRQAQKMESVGQLAAGIAHEINTPIQFVNVNLTFLRKSFQEFAGLLAQFQAAAADLDGGTRARLAQAAEDADLAYLLEELPKVLQDSIEGVQRVARIVRAMKEFSHPGATERTLLDVNRLASSAVTISRNEWKYVSELELDLEEGLPPVSGYAAELSQVFLNLIVNAAHAIADRKADRKGAILLTTRSVEGEVEVRVRDTGLGIAPEHQSRIFEPFFTTKDVGKGTGQGLTICYQNIVKLHLGRIFFETTPGEGTTFIVRLPAASNPVAPAAKGA